MSREEPRFGDVFRWQSETQDTLVMYIAPSTRKDDSSWLGVTLDDHDFLPSGDVDIRVGLGLPMWSEVPDDAD